MRSSMLEVVSSDYTKTARAKGLSDFRITVKHQIRNAITPIITIMGPTVASVLTGTFVIEALFAIPGMGKHYVDSINMADFTKEQFKVVGKNTKTMESISRPNIGYWQDAWRRIRKNKIAFFSL